MPPQTRGGGHRDRTVPDSAYLAGRSLASGWPRDCCLLRLRFISLSCTPGTRPPIHSLGGNSSSVFRSHAIASHGTLADGKVYDSSVERGQPATFPLSEVIPCWTEGLQRRRVGGKAELTCPPDLAYGDRALGPAPPRSVLV